MSVFPAKDSDLKDVFNHLNRTIIPFIKENSDRRISKETLDHYREFSIQRPLTDELIVTQEVDDNKNIVAISIATIIADNRVKYSVTVTSKEHRQKGFGTNVLKAKLEELGKRRMGIKTIVAEDNEASVKLCNKVGLQLIEKVKRKRSTGEFMACIFIDPIKLPEVE